MPSAFRRLLPALLGIAVTAVLACGNDDASKPAVASDAAVPFDASDASEDTNLPLDAADAARVSNLLGKGILRTKGRDIVDATGASIPLRGVNLGNWLLLEMWMTSFAASADVDSDYALRQLITKRFETTTAGAADTMFRALRDHAFAKSDLVALAASGATVVRLPFPYWLFANDAAPLSVSSASLLWLDQFLLDAEAAGLYVILDLHGAQGGQSTNHSTGRVREKAELWDRKNHPEHEAALLYLWTVLATRYRDADVVAGYDVVNEPDEGGSGATLDDMMAFYDRAAKTIRAVDPNHVLIFERLQENVFFSGTFGPTSIANAKAWTNWVQSEHMYFQFGPDGYDLAAKDVTNANIQGKIDYYLAQQKKLGVSVPLNIGELGWSQDDAFDLLPRQAKIFNDDDCSWTVWSHKTWKKSNMGVVYGNGDAASPLCAGSASCTIDPKTASYATLLAAFSATGTNDPSANFVANPGYQALFATYGVKRAP